MRKYKHFQGEILIFSSLYLQLLMQHLDFRMCLINICRKEEGGREGVKEKWNSFDAQSLWTLNK